MKRFVCFCIVAAALSLVALGSVAWSEDAVAALAHPAEARCDDVPRKVLAFYYPWYGNPAVADGSGRWSHWSDVEEDRGRIGSSTHYPALGPYDSHAPKLIAQHATWSKQAGVDGWIVSWWGHGSFSDQALVRILAGAQPAGIEVTVYYETIPRPQTAESAAADISRLLDLYADHPAWLRVAGKPVLFIYGRAVGQIGVEGWLRVIDLVRQKRPGGVVFIGDQMSRAAAGAFDGIHTYNTAGALRDKDVSEVRHWARAQYAEWVKLARSAGRISTLTVIPGYDDTKIRKPGLAVPRYDGASYRCQWQEAIAADPDWILITSWNEWHEGSEIEPSREHGTQYLELTRELATQFKAAPRKKRPPSCADSD